MPHVKEWTFYWQLQFHKKFDAKPLLSFYRVKSRQVKKLRERNGAWFVTRLGKVSTVTMPYRKK